MIPVSVLAQFNYTTNAGTIVITGYTGPGGSVVIPDTLEGLPVTDIGDFAFETSSVLTGITIGNNLTNIGTGAFSSLTNLAAAHIPGNVHHIGIGAFIGCSSLTDLTLGGGIEHIDDYAFSDCSSLTSVTIPDSVILLGWGSFQNCTSLTDVSLPDSVTSIGDLTFSACTSLFRIVIPASVTNIGYFAFSHSDNLNQLFFRGDAPEPENPTFESSTNAVAYYLPGTANWQTNYAGIPTAVWLPFIRGDVSLGAASDDFGFSIDWARGMDIAIDSATNPITPEWTVVATSSLPGEISRFEDPQASNHPHRIYRLRWP